MIGTLFTLTNKFDPSLTITINDHSDPENLIALQDFPSMEVDIRSDEVNREGQHGIWDFFSFYGKRVFIFQGVIVGEDEAHVQAIRDRLSLICALPGQPTTANDGTVVISWTDPAGRAVQSEAKISSSITFARGMHEKFKLDFMLTLKAADPAIESQDIIEVDGVRGYPMGLFSLPFQMPFMIGISLINKFEVENIGSMPANIIIRMFGSTHFPINNPRITNITTGDFMEITTILADETEYIEIDTKEGTVKDQDGIDQSGNILGGSAFPRLAVGENELWYTSDESTGPLSPPVTGLEPDEIVETEHRYSII